MSNQKRIVSFGEILQRLTPKDSNHIEDANIFESYYGGSEANVLIALASMGHKCSFVTVLPNNDLGRAARNHLLNNNVDTSFIEFSGDILGTYYYEQGFGSLSSNVIYNRSNSEVARIKKNEINFDYDRIFKNCVLFHISGISFALSKDCRDVCFEFIKEAKKRRIKVSFDFNYRSKLWSVNDASKIYVQIIKNVDILLCSSSDLKTFLTVDNVEEFYNEYDCEYLVVRDRYIVTNELHKVKATIVHKTFDVTEQYSISEKEFRVIDRVGSGDAFDAGVINELLNGGDIKKALDFGISSFLIKHLIKGDSLNLSEGTLLEWKKK